MSQDARASQGVEEDRVPKENATLCRVRIEGVLDPNVDPGAAEE